MARGGGILPPEGRQQAWVQKKETKKEKRGFKKCCSEFRNIRGQTYYFELPAVFASVWF